MMIAIVIDITEKVDDFLRNDAPLKAIVMDYYVNFIFFYGNLFSSLVIFLSVIFFTSQMAYKSEIVAILSSGTSFNRMLYPYFLSATLLASISFVLNHYVVPRASQERILFEETYIKPTTRLTTKDIHLQIRPGKFVYMDNYSVGRNTGYKFSLEKIKDNKLTEKITADYIQYDTANNTWILKDYLIRTFNGNQEIIEQGKRKSIEIELIPDDLVINYDGVQTMPTPVLKEYIENEKMKGSERIPQYLLELHQRTSYPFATYILTLIGVSFASRKVRGGIGVHIAVSLAIVFIYILAMEVMTVSASKAGLNPLLAVWIPNILFGILAIYFYVRAPK